MPTTQKSRKVITTVRMDPSIKSWAQSYAGSKGIDLSTLINMELFRIRKAESTASYPVMSDTRYGYYSDIARGVDEGNIPTQGHPDISALRNAHIV